MTKIEFTDEHLRVMMTALEVYSRLRSGQIKIAIDTAYIDYSITGSESETIENYVRDIVFPRTFAHEQNHKEAYDEQCCVKRPALNKNSYFEITSSEMLKSGGTLAYEIYSTLRQYVSLKNNDGYEGSGVSYYSPSKITQVPLPVIEGFSADKRFVIKGKAIVNKLDKAHETKNYMKVWQVVGEYMARKYPELEGYSQAGIEKENNYYVMIAKGARKKKNEKNTFAY